MLKQLTRQPIEELHFVVVGVHASTDDHVPVRFYPSK